MKKIVFAFSMFCVIMIDAKPKLKGTYACCRNSFMVKFLADNKFEVTRNSFGQVDEITGTTKISGVFKVDKNILILKNQNQKTTQIKYSRKFKKEIPMLMPTPQKYKSDIDLKMDNKFLYWKNGADWQQLYVFN